MSLPPEKWTEENQVAVIFLKPGDLEKREVLLGDIDSSCYFFPKGMLESEKETVETACRVGEEKTGLIGRNSFRPAEIRVNIIEERKRIAIQVILFSEWWGELKNPLFKFFSLQEILWEKFLPEHKEWIHRVLLDEKPTRVRINYGKNFSELLHVTTEDLT